MTITQIKAFNAKIDSDLEAMLPELEGIYKDIHSHPELSMEEKRTAGIAAGYLKKYNWEVTTGIGGTGVVGLLKNGDGPTVMLRADMDALPITEATGLPYVSTVKAKDEEGREVGVSHTLRPRFPCNLVDGNRAVTGRTQRSMEWYCSCRFSTGRRSGSWGKSYDG